MQCFPCTYSHHVGLQSLSVTLPNNEWKRDVQKYGKYHNMIYFYHTDTIDVNNLKNTNHGKM